MRRLLASLALTVLTAAAPVDRVHVFAGTSNSRWQMFPGATLPFGMVKFSPDNQGNVWNGGYEYTVASISGFGLLHAFSLSGPTLMPVVGKLQVDPSSSRFHPGAPDGPFGGMWTAGYRSRIDKASETGSPGYYAVRLVDYGVRAEVSATMRVGYLRLTYPTSADSHLFVDFDPPTEEKTDILGVDFTQTGPMQFDIHVRQHNQYAGTYDLYVVLQLTKAPSAVRTWTNGEYTGTDTNYGTAWRRPVSLRPLGVGFHGGARTGAILDFATAANETVLVREAASFVSMAGAHANLAAETDAPGWNFDRVVSDARAVWAKLLGRIEVSDETPSRTDMFYTALYRVFAGKSVVSDADGSYRDFAGKIGHLAKPTDAIYSSDGLWGMQWDLDPLWTLAFPDIAVSFANSLLSLGERGGWIPAAPVNLRYAPVMVAQHQDSLIVSAAMKHLPGLDADRAYRAIRHDLTTQGTPLPDGQYAGDRNLTTYMAHGYVPDEDGPSSNTVEYAYDDACLAALARQTGHAEDATLFGRRAANWRNQFDRTTGFMRPRRADGSWRTPFDPQRFGTVGGWNGPGFVEGNAGTYSFWVPQDVAALVDVMGRDRFNQRLQAAFEDGSVDLTNEPGLQSPFLFNYSGKPWLTQKWAREAVDGYDTDPLRGWPGEEDEGQLTAYYVLLAMGLFEMDGGCAEHPAYDLTSPLFRRVILHPAGGRDVTIESQGAPDIYVQSASWNGQPVAQPRIAHDALMHGGTLRYVLGPKPSSWGVTADGDGHAH